MDKYIPPYDITEEMLELTSEIMELLGELKNVNDLEKLPRLRRVSRIKSIHSSLAIENNTLTLKQVTDVIEGKRVLGPEDDIIAVKNAFEVYKDGKLLNPESIYNIEIENIKEFLLIFSHEWEALLYQNLSDYTIKDRWQDTLSDYEQLLIRP